MVDMVGMATTSSSAASRARIARYAVLRLPLLLQQVFTGRAGRLDLALLRLSRFSEMVAIRAAGVSLGRLSLMFLPVAAGVAAAGFTLAEFATPKAEARLAAWWQETDPSAASRARWFRIGGEVARVEGMAADGRELRGISIYRRDAAGLLTSRLSPDGFVAPGGWRCRVSTVRLTPQGPERVFRTGALLARPLGAGRRALCSRGCRISPPPSAPGAGRELGERRPGAVRRPG